MNASRNINGTCILLSVVAPLMTRTLSKVDEPESHQAIWGYEASETKPK